MGCNERQKELKRRRHRKRKMGQLRRRCESATASEKSHIADKIRQLTPGGEKIIDELGLEER